MATYIYSNDTKLEMDGVAGAGIHCELVAHYLSLETAGAAFDMKLQQLK